MNDPHSAAPKLPTRARWYVCPHCDCVHFLLPSEIARQPHCSRCWLRGKAVPLIRRGSRGPDGRKRATRTRKTRPLVAALAQGEAPAGT